MLSDSDSDSAVNKISVLRDSCSNAKTSPFGVKKITTGNICENLSPTKRSPLKSMSPVVVLKDIFRSKEKQRDDIFVEKKAEPSVEARTELEKNLDVNVEEKNDSPLTNERFLTSSSEERSEKKGEDEKEKFTKTSSSQCDSEPSKQMFSSTVKSNESTNFKNECRGNLSSSDLDLLNLNREKGEFYSFVYESEDNETEKYLVDKKIDLAAKTNNFSDLVNKCVIKRCNGKYVVLTSFEGTEILDKSSKKSLTKSFSENSNRSDLEIMKEESCKKNASNKIIESCDIDVPETEEEVTSQRSSIHLDHIEDIPKAKTKSDYFGDAHLAVVEDNLKNATKTKKSIQESDEEINLTSETLQRGKLIT